MSSSAELIRAIAALAWPLVALAGLLIFRAQIRTTLARGFRRVKAGLLEVEWADQLAEVRLDAAASESPSNDSLPSLDGVAGTELIEELRELVKTAPGAAIEEAYSRVEAELRRILMTHTGTSEKVLGGEDGKSRHAPRTLEGRNRERDPGCGNTAQPVRA